MLKFTYQAILIIALCSKFAFAGANDESSYSETQTAIENAYKAYQHPNFVRPSINSSSLTNSKNLWVLAPRLFRMNLHSSKQRVKQQINWLSSNQKFVIRASERARPYFYYVLSQVLKEGLPVELAMLPFIESGYNTLAKSHASAEGAWQFIPSTAKHFGLKNNWWYDGRRDIISSTEAALKYLTQLNKQFKGDWLLALAAYNCGPQCVIRAQKKNHLKGKKVDFWSLKLPLETQKYVPKFLAINKIIRDAKHYGIHFKILQNQRYFNVVKLDNQMEIEQAAKMAGITTQQLFQLNSGFKRWATAPNGPHRLLIPTNKTANFKQQLSKLSSKGDIKWRTVKRLNKESLASVAKRYKTSVEALKALNSNQYSNQYSNQLKIPTNNLKPKQVNTFYLSKQNNSNQDHIKASTKSLTNKYIKAKKATYKPPLNKAAGYNTSSKSKLDRGKQRIKYKVKSGDSIQLVINKFSISKTDLLRWNTNLSSKTYLRPNQTLVLYTKKGIKI